MEPEDAKGIIVQRWLEKATDALESADIEAGLKHFAFGINRLYYASFYALSALNAQQGREFGKHSAVRSVLHRDYVRSGIIAPRFGALYDQLFNDRQEADYRPLRVFQKEDFDALSSETKEFISFLVNLIKTNKANVPEQPAR